MIPVFFASLRGISLWFTERDGKPKNTDYREVAKTAKKKHRSGSTTKNGSPRPAVAKKLAPHPALFCAPGYQGQK
jgi:hypothetical protein